MFGMNCIIFIPLNSYSTEFVISGAINLGAVMHTIISEKCTIFMIMASYIIANYCPD
jgi:hypothetical protein